MREVGAVRKNVPPGVAESYIAIARKHLGQLKLDMQASQLSQLTRVVELADGTKIRVSSIFGQDRIEVLSVPAVPAQAEEEAVASAPAPSREYLFAARRGNDTLNEKFHLEGATAVAADPYPTTAAATQELLWRTRVSVIRRCVGRQQYRQAAMLLTAYFGEDCALYNAEGFGVDVAVLDPAAASAPATPPVFSAWPALFESFKEALSPFDVPITNGAAAIAAATADAAPTSETIIAPPPEWSIRDTDAGAASIYVSGWLGFVTGGTQGEQRSYTHRAKQSYLVDAGASYSGAIAYEPGERWRYTRRRAGYALAERMGLSRTLVGSASDVLAPFSMTVPISIPINVDSFGTIARVGTSTYNVTLSWALPGGGPVFSNFALTLTRTGLNSGAGAVVYMTSTYTCPVTGRLFRLFSDGGIRIQEASGSLQVFDTIGVEVIPVGIVTDYYGSGVGSFKSIVVEYQFTALAPPSTVGNVAMQVYNLDDVPIAHYTDSEQTGPFYKADGGTYFMSSVFRPRDGAYMLVRYPAGVDPAPELLAYEGFPETFFRYFEGVQVDTPQGLQEFKFAINTQYLIL